MTGREFGKKNFVPETIGDEPLLEVKKPDAGRFF